MYKDKKYQANGFDCQDDFIEMIRWLRNLGMTQESIGRLYGVSKMYVSKITHDISPDYIVNRKPKSKRNEPRPETGA